MAVKKRCSWIAYFLANRSQGVVFAGVKSVPTSFLYGLQHFSVWGPLLFILHTADVIKIVESLLCGRCAIIHTLPCKLQLTLPLQSLGYLPALVL